MQKIHILLFIFLCCICGIHAQEIQLIQMELNDTITPMEISNGQNLDMPNFQWERQVKNDPFQSLKFDGYNNFYTHPIDDKLYYSLYGSLTIAPGLYTSQKAGTEIGMQINRSFLVNFGAYGMKYDYNFAKRPYYDAVLHLDASYQISPWLIVGAYGQYAAFSVQNAKHHAMLPSPMVPYSAYGVHATTMFTETFGIQGLVGKEFNPISGKWRPVYGIAPVINLNKVFK